MGKEMSVNLAEQLNLAQELLIKFFKETSFLIKETELQLKKLPEEFIILQTTGYGVATVGSAGIEYPEWWLPPYFGVMFAPSKFVEKDKRGTRTKVQPLLKLIFAKIVLRDENIKEPEIWFGLLKNIKANSYYSKFEIAVSDFFYYWLTYNKKWLDKEGPFTFEQTDNKWVNFKGTLKRIKLLSLSSSDDIKNDIINAIVSFD